MRKSFPTPDEIRKNFKTCLKDAVDIGLWPPTEQGFDYETERAIKNVARSYPNVREDLIRKAKAELEFQLDGSHIKAREARIAALQAGR